MTVRQRVNRQLRAALTHHLASEVSRCAEILVDRALGTRFVPSLDTKKLPSFDCVDDRRAEDRRAPCAERFWPDA